MVTVVITGFTAIAISFFALALGAAVWVLYHRGSRAGWSGQTVALVVATPVAVALVTAPLAFAWGYRSGVDRALEGSGVLGSDASPRAADGSDGSDGSDSPADAGAATSAPVAPGPTPPTSTTPAVVATTSTTPPSGLGTLIAGPKAQTTGGVTVTVTQIANEQCGGTLCGYLELKVTNKSRYQISFDPSGGAGNDTVYVIDGAGNQHRSVEFFVDGCETQYESIESGAVDYPLKYCFDVEFEKGPGKLAAGIIDSGAPFAVRDIPGVP